MVKATEYWNGNNAMIVWIMALLNLKLPS